MQGKHIELGLWTSTEQGLSFFCSCIPSIYALYPRSQQRNEKLHRRILQTSFQRLPPGIHSMPGSQRPSPGISSSSSQLSTPGTLSTSSQPTPRTPSTSSQPITPSTPSTNSQHRTTGDRLHSNGVDENSAANKRLCGNSDEMPTYLPPTYSDAIEARPVVRDCME